MRACCQCIYEPFGSLKKENGENYHASRDSFLQARNSDVMKELRRDLLSGKKPEVCRLCWQEESVGTVSRRKREVVRYPKIVKKIEEFGNPDGSIDHTQFPLTYIDLRLGNNCNLKCRYCGPSDSRSWYDDFVKLHFENSPEAPNFNFYGTKYDLVKNGPSWDVSNDDFSWPQNPQFLTMLDQLLDYVDRLYFTGGEPTLIKAHWDLLDSCVKKGIAKNIYLEYNSNLSVLTDKHFETWSHFRGVGLGCSIDGYGDAAAYLRPPVPWATVDNTFRKIANAGFRIDALISSTLSIFNLLNYMEIIRYNLEFISPNISRIPVFHFLENPAHYSPKILSQAAKNFVIHSYDCFFKEISVKLSLREQLQLAHAFKTISTYLHSEDRSHLIKDFYRETERLDALRGQEFRKVFPEIHKLLQMR
jgi:sulfatase maturation enzyme AslB (radical SAM superfamily)